VDYYGGGLDAGTQVEVIPFLKLGFMVQDIGTIMKPRSAGLNVKDKIDFAAPTLRLSAAMASRSTDFLLAFSAVKKLEQKDYEINVGIQYNVIKYVSIYLGVNDGMFSTGAALKIWSIEAGYAFCFDRINHGYNNLVSLIFTW
jgi:hypothetical protein